MKYIFLINSAQNQRCIKRVNEFVERGYDVEAYAFSRQTEMRNEPKFELHIIGEFSNAVSYRARLSTIWKGVRSVIRQQRGKGKCVWYLFGLDIAMAFRLQSRAPYVFEESDLAHTYTKNSLLCNVLERIDKHIIRRSRITVFTSEGFARYHFGQSVPHNVCFIPNRLHPDVCRFSPQKQRCTDTSHLRFAFVGGARFQSVFRFAETLLRRFPQHEFHFFGHVVVNFESLFETLEAYPNCFFHGAFKNPDDLQDIYAATDIVVSTYDTAYANIRYAEPNKLYEAVFFETPIVVSSGTFLAERVSELGIGFNVDPLSEEAVVNFVEALTPEAINSRQEAARHIDKAWAINRNDAFFERIQRLTAALS